MLLCQVTDRSRVPLIGDAPLMLKTAAEARGKPPSEAQALTMSEVQMAVVPYAELCRRPALFAELRGRVAQLKQQPSRLMAMMGVPSGAPSRSASKATEGAERGGIVSTPTRPRKQADGLVSSLISRDRPTGAILQGSSRPTSRVNSPQRSPDSRAHSPLGASRETPKLA